MIIINCDFVSIIKLYFVMKSKLPKITLHTVTLAQNVNNSNKIFKELLIFCAKVTIWSQKYLVVYFYSRHSSNNNNNYNYNNKSNNNSNNID